VTAPLAPGAGASPAGTSPAGLGAPADYPEWATFGVGSVTYPLTADTTNGTLADADPTIGATLDYLEWALGFYMGARWTAECNALGMAPEIGAAPVAYKVPYDPSDYLVEQQVKLPLLAVFRTRQTNLDWTINYIAERGEWSIAWVMPPLTSGQLERLWPFTRAAAAIISHALSVLEDPNWQSGAQALAAVGAMNVEVIDSVYGKAQVMGANTNLVMPGIQMRIAVTEMGAPVPDAFAPIDSSDTNMNLTTVDGTSTVIDVAQVRSTNP